MSNEAHAKSYGEDIVFILIHFQQHLVGCLINCKLMKCRTIAELDTYLVIANCG